MDVKALIDKAAEKVQGRSALARTLDVPPQHVTDWAAGRRVCSPEDRARLAALVGNDPVQELVRATLENAKGERRREQLAQILGKLSRQTGAALNTAVLGMVSLIGLTLADMGEHAIRCILC